MTRLGIALTAASLLSSGPALACGHAYSAPHGYQVIHLPRAAHAVKDAGFRRSSHAAVALPTTSAPADEALGSRSQATAAAACKEYSATVGYMIAVACAK